MLLFVTDILMLHLKTLECLDERHTSLKNDG